MIPQTLLKTAACAALFRCVLLCGAAWAGPSMIVALLQTRPDGNNIAANLDKAERFCRDAAAKGADIALMPEMWSIGYPRLDPDAPGAREKFYTLALAAESPEIQRFSALARELDMAIAVTYMQACAPLPRNDRKPAVILKRALGSAMDHSNHVRFKLFGKPALNQMAPSNNVHSVHSVHNVPGFMVKMRNWPAGIKSSILRSRKGNRHSRENGNPKSPDWRNPLLLLDSRVRGNDGGGLGL